jgi:hypothetical protein
MALFWSKHWKTKTKAESIRKKHTYGYGTIKKTKKGWGIYADTPSVLRKKLAHK